MDNVLTSDEYRMHIRQYLVMDIMYFSIGKADTDGPSQLLAMLVNVSHSSTIIIVLTDLIQE